MNTVIAVIALSIGFWVWLGWVFMIIFATGYTRITVVKEGQIVFEYLSAKGKLFEHRARRYRLAREEHGVFESDGLYVHDTRAGLMLTKNDDRE